MRDQWSAQDDWDDPEDPRDAEAPPDWFPGGHLPEDARRMGLTHHVAEGALLDFAGKLDAAKPLHRYTAWALLVVFGLPVVFALMRLFNAIRGY
ncbi:hypothetical protein [Nocardioides sp.]|uniref:hypothetical protein n=1 Tax=Nocardioides sp. TaxID=35761 RepID=UPI003565014F